MAHPMPPVRPELAVESRTVSDPSRHLLQPFPCSHNCGSTLMEYRSSVAECSDVLQPLLLERLRVLHRNYFAPDHKQRTGSGPP